MATSVYMTEILFTYNPEYSRVGNILKGENNDIRTVTWLTPSHD